MKNLRIDTHIVLVYPPAAAIGDEMRRTHFKMCLGGAYITAYLARYKLHSRTFLTSTPVNAAGCAAGILSFNSPVAGFTVDSSNYSSCRLIAKSLKEIAPSIIIVFGGLLPTLQSDVIMKNNPWVDICARGESEKTCRDLLFALGDVDFDLSKASLEQIHGISYRFKDRIFSNPDRPSNSQTANTADILDKYPSPYLSGVAVSPRMGIVTARGCNQNCIYCMCPAVSQRKISTHSIDRVIAELDYIARWTRQNPMTIDVFDDTFTLIPGRALAICRKIIENRVRLPLACTTRCDKVDEELLEAMKDAGFQSIEFSLESAVPRILRVIGRVQPPDTSEDPGLFREKEFLQKLRESIDYSRKIGIKNVYTSIMVGLPTETPGEAMETMGFIRSLGDAYDFYGHNFFHAKVSTPAFTDKEKWGIDVEPMGSNVQYRTLHRFNPYDIPLGPRSSVDVMGNLQDRANIKILALRQSTKELNSPHKNKPYFHHLILCKDEIDEELVTWLHRYLALNGSLIHIYSNSEAALRLHRQNEDMLDRFITPTHYYVSYSRSNDKLVPLRTILYKESNAVPIQLVKTSDGLSPGKSAADPRMTLCIDDPLNLGDITGLHNLLAGAEGFKCTFETLLNRPFYPYFSSICRWSRGENSLTGNNAPIPNCQSFHTMIVDAGGGVKTCWNGYPIGKVGTALEELIENTVKIKRELEFRRACLHCEKQTTCSRCLFTGPLAETDFCKLKKTSDTHETVELLDAVEMLKEVEMNIDVEGMAHVEG